MLNLLSLNEDVLLLILSDIDGGNALSLSLASKGAYELAGSRIASSVRCRRPDQLRRLHEYMLAPWNGGAARAFYLQKLVIESDVFLSEEEAQAVTSRGMADFSQVHLLSDILLKADHIRELSLDRAHGCIMKDPRIVVALCAMSRLANCQLHAVVDGTLIGLQSMQTPSFTQLTLDYTTLDKDLLSEEPRTLPPLLFTLSHFRSLRIVKLSSFIPLLPLVALGNPSVPYPRLPSILHLELHDCAIYALDMVPSCSNLTVLVFSCHHKRLLVTMTAALPAHHRSLSLQRLMLDKAKHFIWIQNYIERVDRLEITDPFDAFDDPQHRWFQRTDGPAETLDLVARTSPIGLYLSVEVDPELPGSQVFWTSLSNEATRLRSLDLKVTGAKEVRSDPDNDTWIDALPDALSPLRQLLCLRVLVPAIPRTRVWPPAPPYLKPSLEHEDTTVREKLRALALDDLPQRLINAIPSLRYLAIGVESEDLKHAETSVRRDRDELRLVDSIGKIFWWQIKRDEGRLKVKEICEEVGEEAQRLIERPGLDEGSSLEAALRALSL